MVPQKQNFISSSWAALLCAPRNRKWGRSLTDCKFSYSHRVSVKTIREEMVRYLVKKFPLSIGWGIVMRGHLPPKTSMYTVREKTNCWPDRKAIDPECEKVYGRCPGIRAMPRTHDATAKG